MPTTMMPTTMMPTTTMPTTMNPTEVPAALSCTNPKSQELTIAAGESTKYCWTRTFSCEQLYFSGATGERLYFILKLVDQNVIKKRIFTLGNP
eukprot:7037_1